MTSPPRHSRRSRSPHGTSWERGRGARRHHPKAPPEMRPSSAERAWHRARETLPFPNSLHFRTFMFVAIFSDDDAWMLVNRSWSTPINDVIHLQINRHAQCHSTLQFHVPGGTDHTASATAISIRVYSPTISAL